MRIDVKLNTEEVHRAIRTELTRLGIPDDKAYELRVWTNQGAPFPSGLRIEVTVELNADSMAGPYR